MPLLRAETCADSQTCGSVALSVLCVGEAAEEERPRSGSTLMGFSAGEGSMALQMVPPGHTQVLGSPSAALPPVDISNHCSEGDGAHPASRVPPVLPPVLPSCPSHFHDRNVAGREVEFGRTEFPEEEFSLQSRVSFNPFTCPDCSPQFLIFFSI